MAGHYGRVDKASDGIPCLYIIAQTIHGRLCINLLHMPAAFDCGRIYSPDPFAMRMEERFDEEQHYFRAGMTCFPHVR